VIYANEVLLKFLGSTQNDLYGKNIEYTSLVTIFDDAFSLLVKKVRAGLKGVEWTGELSLKNKDVIFSCRIKPAVFEEGQRGVSLILEDITERKRSEQRVKESERQFRLLAENSLDMIHRHTPNDVCIYISPASKTILGYNPDELIGHSIFEVLHPEDAHIVPEYKSGLNKKNHTAKISYRVRHRDGHYVWLESVIRAIFDEKTGEFVEIYGVTRDISKRKKAEDALRESEERYRSLAEASHDLIFTVDRDDAVTYVNSFAAAMLRRDPAAIVGMDRASLFPRELADRQAAGLRRVFESGTPFRSEGPMAVNGKVRWFDHFLMPVVGPGGRVDSVLGVSRDITEKKEGGRRCARVRPRNGHSSMHLQTLCSCWICRG
jgi:PAS domain S-box-containing protein